MHSAASANADAPPLYTAARPLRALHVHPGHLYGGLETFLRALVRGAAHCPWAVHEFALSYQRRLADELRAAGAVVHPLGEVRLRTPLRALLARRRLASLLARGRYDVAVIHSAWTQTLFGSVPHARGVPLAFVQHNGGTDGTSLLERLARRHRPDVAVANSAFTAESLPRLFPGVPTRVVTLPAELPVIEDPEAERGRIRGAMNADPETTVVLLVSRLERGKGVHLALEALAGMHAKRPWVCWVAGAAHGASGERYERELRAIANAPALGGRVKFLGERRDVPVLLRGADVFCQANVSPESFGMTFVEALWAGLPVVTTAMGGALEIVDDSCGRLVPPRADSVAGALATLIDDPALRARLALVAPARARQLCDPGTQVPRFAEAIASAIAYHRGR